VATSQRVQPVSSDDVFNTSVAVIQYLIDFLQQQTQPHLRPHHTGRSPDHHQDSRSLVNVKRHTANITYLGHHYCIVQMS